MKRVFFPAWIGLVLVSSSCQEESAPPTKPDPVPVVTQSWEASRSDGDVLLTLTVSVVSSREVESLSLSAVARNVGSHRLRYDGGGCGCPTPGLSLLDETGAECFIPRPLCPCWSVLTEFQTRTAVTNTELYPRDCFDGGSGRATAGFVYSIWNGNEWVPRQLQVGLTVPSE
jgi:hypothetical protein